MFDWRRASPHFLYLLGVIFGQKTMKKTSRCCAYCWYFLPLKNHVFYRLPCLRTVFLQICWNTENLAKKREKSWKNEVLILLAKSSQKSLAQAPKIDPKSPILAGKIAKIRQKCEGKRIFDASIFRAKKKSGKHSKKGPQGLNLTSRGNGKRNEKSDGTMLPSVAICGNWYDHAVISCCAWELTLEAWSLRL